MSKDSGNTLYCSFCGKSQDEVKKLIAGPTVYICDGCVSMAMDLCEKPMMFEIDMMKFSGQILSSRYRDLDVGTPITENAVNNKYFQTMLIVVSSENE